MKILGLGSALPKRCVTNDELTQIMDTSDEWIRTRTGISSRRVLTDETLTGLGAEAARLAMLDAGIDGVDFVIGTTVQGDTTTPSLSCSIIGELGLSCAGTDLNSACAGFVFALDMADALIASGRAKKILIVSAEANSRICDWTDRSTAVLFGDGAGAAVVGEGEGYMAGVLTVQSNTDALHFWPEPGNSPYAADHQHPYAPLYMAGQDVYKFAVSAIASDTKAACQKAGIEPDDIDLFALHQANMRIIDAARVRLKQPESKFPHNIERTGNTGSASIPILLDELKREGKILPGMTLLMSGFGAGLTTGTCIIRW